MEEENPLEAKEKLDELAEGREGWKRYLALTTAVVAVLAAVASMRSGNLANSALLQKNDAILAQTRASDQWGYFQAKGIKRALAEGLEGAPDRGDLRAKAAREAGEQTAIQAKAEALEKEAAAADRRSEAFLERHERGATAVTLFQIAIALSAMAALLDRKWFWYLSIGLSAVGLAFLAAAGF